MIKFATHNGAIESPLNFVTVEQAEQLALDGRRVLVLGDDATLASLVNVRLASGIAYLRDSGACVCQIQADYPELSRTTRDIRACASGIPIHHYFGIIAPFSKPRGKTTGVRNETADRRVHKFFAVVRKIVG